jgi:hypothetical protein
MSRAFNHTEQLRAGQNKVEDLRDEEEDECLGKVTLQCNRREGHSAEVAERVPGESAGRIPEA